MTPFPWILRKKVVTTAEPSSATTYMSHSLDLPHDNSRKVIYRYKRSLEGIVGQYHTDDPTTTVASALGPAADNYLHAHGYLPGTVRLIQQMFEVASTKEAFVEALAQQGVPVAEAIYLHSLI